MFTIESGIEIPKSKSKLSPLWEQMLATMKKMEVGQSFFVPEATAMSRTVCTEMSRTLNKRINQTLLGEIAKTNPYWFTASKITDANGKVLGTRIWRRK